MDRDELHREHHRLLGETRQLVADSATLRAEMRQLVADLAALRAAGCSAEGQ